MIFQLAILVIVLIESCFGETYAVLLSGIGIYEDLGYASEAAVYQSYNDLVKGGIKEENIIVFSYDIVAFDPKNPFPGEIYSYENGPNVYPAVKGHVDYSGKDNNPTNFLKVLNGDDMTGIGSGRTLETTEEDDIFVVTMQHGELGMLFYYYPHNVSYTIDDATLWAADVIKTLKDMQKARKFNHLIWFMCSCYAGSNFNNQFENDGFDNVFIMTSAPVSSSALACSYSSKVQTSINCCFHQNWQAFLRENNPEKSLMDQFLYSYLQKSNEGGMLAEEYCYYGSTKYANSQNIGDIEGRVNKTKRRINQQQQQQTRDLEIHDDVVISMKDVRKRRQERMMMMKKNNNKMRKQEEEKVVQLRPVPYYGMTQLTYSGFDANYQNCYVPNKMNLTCTKEVFNYCFHNGQELMNCCQKEEVMDFIKIACSEGVVTTADQIIEIVKQTPDCLK